MAFEADEMDEANQELRITIKKIWPLQAKKVLDLIIPQDQGILVACQSAVFTLPTPLAPTKTATL